MKWFPNHTYYWNLTSTITKYPLQAAYVNAVQPSEVTASTLAPLMRSTLQKQQMKYAQNFYQNYHFKTVKWTKIILWFIYWTEFMELNIYKKIKWIQFRLGKNSITNTVQPRQVQSDRANLLYLRLNLYWHNEWPFPEVWIGLAKWVWEQNNLYLLYKLYKSF